MIKDQINIQLMSVSQPIGTFYLGKVNAGEIIGNLGVNRRKDIGKEENEGIQRKINEKRIREIKAYVSNPEATFPTPIIISIYDEFSKDLVKQDNGFFTFVYNKEDIIGEIIDGQHRVAGLKLSDNIKEFEFVIIFMFNLEEEQKAYVFTTINSNQRSVPKSLIYDLFAVTSERSPYKTCHEIARLLNKDEKSPLYKRLKMLGEKNNKSESLSQGTFVNGLVKLISNNPEVDMSDIKQERELIEDNNLPFRSYFIANEDYTIYKIILNMFEALSEVFEEEWKDTEKYILMRAVGYMGIMKAFPYIFKKCKQDKDLSKGNFISIFKKLKFELYKKNLELSFENFEANGKGQNKFSKIIEDSVK